MLTPRVEPLPSEKQFEQAFHEVHHELLDEGGLGLHLASRALMVAVDRNLETQDRAVARYGIYFVDEALGADEDASYDACYAYVNGFMVTNRVLDRVFAEPHPFEGRIASLEHWFQDQKRLTSAHSDVDAVLQGERQILEQFGAFGIQQIGDVAVETLQGWSDEAYPDRERLARAFCLGSGAVVSCGIAYQHSINYWASVQVEVPASFDDELQKILNSEGE